MAPKSVCVVGRRGLEKNGPFVGGGVGIGSFEWGFMKSFYMFALCSFALLFLREQKGFSNIIQPKAQKSTGEHKNRNLTLIARRKKKSHERGCGETHTSSTCLVRSGFCSTVRP